MCGVQLLASALTAIEAATHELLWLLRREAPATNQLPGSATTAPAPYNCYVPYKQSSPFYVGFAWD
jgi:hypothetical protein